MPITRVGSLLSPAYHRSNLLSKSQRIFFPGSIRECHPSVCGTQESGGRLPKHRPLCICKAVKGAVWQVLHFEQHPTHNNCRRFVRVTEQCPMNKALASRRSSTGGEVWNGLTSAYDTQAAFLKCLCCSSCLRVAYV